MQEFNEAVIVTAGSCQILTLRIGAQGRARVGGMKHLARGEPDGGIRWTLDDLLREIFIGRTGLPIDGRHDQSEDSTVASKWLTKSRI